MEFSCKQTSECSRAVFLSKGAVCILQANMCCMDFHPYKTRALTKMTQGPLIAVFPSESIFLNGGSLVMWWCLSTALLYPCLYFSSPSASFACALLFFGTLLPQTANSGLCFFALTANLPYIVNKQLCFSL